MEPSTQNVAIVGGGLASMAMALELHNISIPSGL
ncbi:hypothetical protein ANO14919_123730 [Xylariales sp. No.14919]|nr:hypothetical protein ANO14919_123730 [Xylariales sp. No.14919]